MDRTRNKGEVEPPKSESGQSVTDPFKEKLEREGRKRFSRRDPRILGPGEADTDGLASRSNSRIGEDGAAKDMANLADPFVPVGRTGALTPEDIIPPGEVFVDPALTTELVQQGEGAFVLPSEAIRTPTVADTSADAGAGASAAGIGLAPSNYRPQLQKGSAEKPGVSKPGARGLGLARLNEPARPISASSRSPKKPEKAMRASPGDRPITTDSHQDDIATGAIAALFLLLAGWIGFQVTTQQSPVARRGEDASVRVGTASAPTPDPFAGAPIDLRPTSPAPVAEPGGAEGPARGSDNESIFTGAAAAGGAPPRLGAPAMSPQVLAPFLLPALMTAPATAVSEAAIPLPLSCDPNMVTRAYFCTAKTELTPASKALLEKSLATLRACASGNELVVTGYADTRGLIAMNAQLSAGRAESVAQFLKSKGLAAVAVSGAGELSDIEDGRNCANQRRVDISLKNGSPPPSRACTPPEAMAAVVCG